MVSSSWRGRAQQLIQEWFHVCFTNYQGCLDSFDGFRQFPTISDDFRRFPTICDGFRRFPRINVGMGHLCGHGLHWTCRHRRLWLLAQRYTSPKSLELSDTLAPFSVPPLACRRGQASGMPSPKRLILRRSQTPDASQIAGEVVSISYLQTLQKMIFAIFDFQNIFWFFFAHFV